MVDKSICNRCGKEIEWHTSKKTGKKYPVNPGTKPGDENYFHSSTCSKTLEKIPELSEQNINKLQPFKTADQIPNTSDFELKMRLLAFKSAFEMTLLEYQNDPNMNFNQCVKSKMEEFVKIIGGYE